MLRQGLTLVLLFVLAVSVATYLEPRLSSKAGAEGKSESLFGVLLGDGRTLFANQFEAKADAYFHRGKYPSIFDQPAPEEQNHMVNEAAHAGHEHVGESHVDSDGDEDEHAEKPEPPHDWIEAFGRHFYPSEHIHLEGDKSGEMLPWLSLAIEMDPHQIEVYAVTAYFLRDRMGKPREAEDFLRKGLRDNPRNPELLYQLGLCFAKEGDTQRADNLLRAALASWNETERQKETPDLLLLRNILRGLTQIAEKNGSTDQAVGYLEQLKAVSPEPDQVQLRIDELRNHHPGTPQK